jgi:2-methylcitrate dehydratase
MDKITGYLANYGCSIKYEDIPPDVVHKTKGLLIDTLGCALGGYSSEPAQIAFRMAQNCEAHALSANIIGTSLRAPLSLAAFANGIMLRYLDFNDGFDSNKMGAHPSDNFGPVLTCADAVHASGKDIIIASVLAYEVYCRFGDKVNPAERNFDQTIAGVLSGTVAVARLLGLTREQTVQAINLALTANITLGQTRVEEVSMWKACAAANAARNAIFAALLAKDGMTGPSPIFEGRHGMFAAVTGKFSLDEFGGNGRPFRIMDANIKRYPFCQLGQTAADAAIKLRSKISGADEIAKIKVQTFDKGKDSMAGDAEKWHPTTRETADHSMPYIVSTALIYGDVDQGRFDEEYLHNPTLLDLMQKVEVEVTEECNRLHPGAKPNRVEITTKDGKKYSEFVKYHHGHHLDPLNDKEIEAKFNTLAINFVSQSQIKQIFDIIWNLEKLDDASKILNLLQIKKAVKV